MQERKTLNQHLSRNIELGITFCLSAFYLGIDLPSPIPSALALVSFLIIPLLIIRQWKEFIYVATRDIPLILAVGLAVISVVWSTNPEATLAHSRALLFSTAFGIYLATRYPPKEQMRLMVWLFGIYMLLSLITSLILPSYGTDINTEGLSWQGIAGHKNALSAAMGMAAMLFLDLALYGYKYRPILSLGAGISFLLIVLSKGKGGLGVFMALLPLLPLYKLAKQEYRLRTFFGIFAFVIGLVMILATLVNLKFITVELLGKDMELTGRIPLWNYLIQRGLEKSWLGYGYGAFWTNPKEVLQVALNVPWMSSIADGVTKAHAHSAYIDLFLQLGWLGVSLVTLSFVTILVRVVLLLGLTKQIEYFWMLQLLLFMAMGNIANNSGEFLAYRSLYWVLYVSTACSTAIHLKRILKTGNKLENLQYENTTYQHQRS
jgi:exopolysaccharide production protein ExoQ